MAKIQTNPVTKVDCPRCHSTKGIKCVTPKGRTVFTPHVERFVAMSKLPAHEIFQDISKPKHKIGDRFAQNGTFGPFARISRVFKKNGEFNYTLTGEQTDRKTTFSEKDLTKKCYKL